jgi:ribosomal protein S27AE
MSAGGGDRAAGRKCYNCGPGPISKHDAKWLCERCKTLYYFDTDGAFKAWKDVPR